MDQPRIEARYSLHHKITTSPDIVVFRDDPMQNLGSSQVPGYKIVTIVTCMYLVVLQQSHCSQYACLRAKEIACLTANECDTQTILTGQKRPQGGAEFDKSMKILPGEDANSPTRDWTWTLRLEILR